MKTLHVTIIIIATISVAISTLIFLSFYNDNVRNNFLEYDLEYFPINDICDISCKERLEEQEFTCVEIEPDSYMCRDKIIPNNGTQIYTYVIPPELGEYYLIKPDSKIDLSSIVQISLHQDDSIQVFLENELGSHNIIIEKGKSFTSLCLYDNLRVWTFTNTIVIEGETYIEMHKRLAKIPEEFDCDDPILIL